MDSSTLNFADFPEDVQLCILSFLAPSDIATFACTSSRSNSLCRSDKKLWYAMCDRRWGGRTDIRKWGGGKVAYKALYRTLNEWEDLIGFWRRSGLGQRQSAGIEPPALVFFEWGVSYLGGFRVSPGRGSGYGVVKSPFLMMGLGESGEVVNFLDPDGRSELTADLDVEKLGFSDSDLISVNVSFMGRNHLMVEENSRFGSLNSNSAHNKKNGISRSSSSGSVKVVEEEDVAVMAGGDGVFSGSPGSFPDRLMVDIYQYFANRTSPVSDRATRRQRRREKERRKWEAEHFVKIVDCSPTLNRPLQGLWKGISDDDTNLDFYLVAYDDIGGVACRRVGDSCKPFSSYSPVFWTSDSTLIESPFSHEEECLYASRIHLQPSMAENYFTGNSCSVSNEPVSRIMLINSSYDLVIPNLTAYSRQVEGRVWQYRNGTFGFGFLRDSFIIDLRHIVQDGCLLDVVGSRRSE
uniref:F-box protein n=1 Tax=Kalanchoe fedtschenkoi TaxID=63787 RepID=A0A7N0RBW0_KALFE